MHIREAMPNDNDELQELQAQCPMGDSFIISTVNTPGFFARAKAYELYKVYVACADNRIIGSAALAIREAVVNSNVSRVGYEFQYFTSPGYRRRGVARLLHQNIEHYLTKQGVVLSFVVIMKGNLPSMQFFESQGFKVHRTLVMAIQSVYKEMDIPSRGRIRPVTSEDLAAVADLLNENWQDYDLYEPTSAEALARFVNRTPAYSFDSLLVLEDQGELLACLGFWDWSQIMRITVKALNLRLRMIALMSDITRYIRPMPRAPKVGTTFKLWCLTPIAFKDPEQLATLFRYINNRAIQRGIDQIFCICEQNHVLLSSMRGLFRTDVALHLYVKPLQKLLIGDNPVFVDAIDL